MNPFIQMILRSLQGGGGPGPAAAAGVPARPPTPQVPLGQNPLQAVGQRLNIFGMGQNPGVMTGGPGQGFNPMQFLTNLLQRGGMIPPPNRVTQTVTPQVAPQGGQGPVPPPPGVAPQPQTEPWKIPQKNPFNDIQPWSVPAGE